MSQTKVFLMLIAVVLSGAARADDQSDADIKRMAESTRTRTLSYLDKTTNLEYVYDVDAATAKKLPKGVIKNLNAANANSLEDVIDGIRKQQPKKVVAINDTKEAATTACWGSYWYSSPYSYYSYYSPIYYGSSWYGGSYYGGGGFYGGYGYGGYYDSYYSVWPYSGCYGSY